MNKPAKRLPAQFSVPLAAHTDLMLIEIRSSPSRDMSMISEVPFQRIGLEKLPGGVASDEEAPGKGQLLWLELQPL